jgi:pyruvate formate lyase activating enzyme
MITPNIFDTKQFVAGQVNHVLLQSFVDGPGNRAVVFLQGCNFHCLYCHNPFTINLCNSCGVCVARCPSGALTKKNGLVYWNEEICNGCDTCIKVCPRFSSPKIKQTTPGSLWKDLLPYSAFLSGISVSGGEPSLQIDFLGQFFQLIKSTTNLTTLIETNGYAGPAAYDILLPVLDMALVDLKIMDQTKHQQLTGQENFNTLETIRYLHENEKLKGINEVIVPGFHTDDDIIHAASFIAGLDPTIPFKLLRFRPHGTAGTALNWDSPTDVTMDRFVALAQNQGLVNVSRSL